MKLKPKRLLFACVGCLVVVVGYVWAKSPSPQENALADVKLAIKKGDARFVTVRGYTISVPGIDGDTQNGLVVSHGKKPPIGVGDAFFTPLDSRRQDAAELYAEVYNTYLLNSLLDHPDALTVSFLKQVRQEMKQLEHADARSDALRSFRSTPTFLGVFVSELGYSFDDSRTSRVNIRWLQMNKSVLRGAERRKFDRIVKTYVLPYNQILYKQLKKKWEKQGVKDLVAL